MRRQLLALAGLAGAGLLLLASGSAQAAPLGPVKTGSEAAAEWDRLLQIAGVSEDWRRFFALQARKESRFNANTFLGLPALQPPGTEPSSVIDQYGESEYRAARNMYLGTPYLAACQWGEDRYSVAGGIVGLLAANAVRPYKGTTLECIDPWKMFDIREAVPMAYGHARALYVNRNPTTWLEMASAWGIPAKTKDPDRLAELRVRLKRHLDALDIPVSWLDTKIDPLPRRDLVAMRDLVFGAVGYAPPVADADVVEYPFGDPALLGAAHVLWLHADLADRDHVPQLVAELDSDGCLAMACVHRVEDCMAAIERVTDHVGPVALVAHGPAAGWTLAAGCASGERVAAMFLVDPTLPPCFELARTTATIRAWATQSSDPRAVGQATATAIRAGADVLSASAIYGPGDLATVWPYVIDAMSEGVP